METDTALLLIYCGLASMGPRSDNRGYGKCDVRIVPVYAIASMGPRSDNRGYGDIVVLLASAISWLQWVHGPITVVMASWMR